MIPPVSRRSTQNPLKPQKTTVASRAPRSLRVTCVAAAIAWLAAVPAAHDLERTHVLISFSNDGSFVIDVANDPSWLKLRMETFPGSFADRVVLWVDGREIRPVSVEFRPFDLPLASQWLAQGKPREGLAIHRLRGRMPIDAHTLRWYYGLVIDPYPLTVRRADGRVVLEEIQGDAWSRTIDLSGQFHAPLLSDRSAGALVAALLLVPVAIRIATKTRKREKQIGLLS
jgi:hypothetical protein